jgi:hypothetical protein
LPVTSFLRTTFAVEPYSPDAALYADVPRGARSTTRRRQQGQQNESPWGHAGAEGAGEAQPFIVDQHLAFAQATNVEMPGATDDFDNGVGNVGVRIISWRDIDLDRGKSVPAAPESPEAAEVPALRRGSYAAAPRVRRGREWRGRAQPVAERLADRGRRSGPGDRRGDRAAAGTPEAATAARRCKADRARCSGCGGERAGLAPTCPGWRLAQRAILREASAAHARRFQGRPTRGDVRCGSADLAAQNNLGQVLCASGRRPRQSLT